MRGKFYYQCYRFSSHITRLNLRYSHSNKIMTNLNQLIGNFYVSSELNTESGDEFELNMST